LQFVLAGTLLLLPHAVTAQGPRHAELPPSVSEIVSGNPSASGKTAQPVTQPQLADAILGDALGRLYTQGDRHFHEGEYNHIINLSRVIVEGDPANVNAYSNSAFLLWSTDRNDEAIAFLQRGLKANPNNYYMYDELGQHYLIAMKDPVRALPYYEKAVKFKCPWFTWNCLAHAYEKTNQWDKAVAAWQTATNYPDDDAAATNLKRARAELAKRQGQKN
jgi:tetratricopeptide (TPR) repeat protein